MNVEAADELRYPGELGSRNACAVKLPAFEGPLDLLLHLIRIHEVPIHDIPIALIAEQYLEYLELMRTLDVDVAAEYLLMAATLAHLKSRMLLPPDGSDDEGEGEDPRLELAQRLAEYAVIKAAAEALGARSRLGNDVFTGLSDASEVPEREGELRVSLAALVDAMRRVIEGLPAESRAHEVLREPVTVQECMVAVMDKLREAGSAGVRSLLFEDLVRGLRLDREWVIATFLAILELAKIQVLRLFQNARPGGAPGGPIRVRLAVVEGELPDAAAPAE